MTTYTDHNFKTKKEFKGFVDNGERVSLFNPGLGTPPLNGKAFVSGPHAPKPHTWYAEVMVKDGYVISVK